jgi:tetratricopeptide (TPR) repeat protein
MATTALRPESSPEWHQTVLGFVARAKALDPLNAWVAAIDSIILSMIGRTNEAVDAGRRAIQLDENNFTAHWFYASALAGAGREDEAMAAASRGLAMSGRNPFILTIVASIHATRGATQEAEVIRAELAERAAIGYIGEGVRACAAAAAGKWEEARTLLRQAIDERDPYLTFWKLYAWRPIWQDAECAAMIRATSLFSDTRRSSSNQRLIHERLK